MIKELLLLLLLLLLVLFLLVLEGRGSPLQTKSAGLPGIT